MDRLDLKALETLVDQGRITWAELASVLGLSAPAAADRVRQLENTGVIQHYTAILDPSSLGFHLTAFIAITLERPQYRDGFLEAVQNMPEIQECHHVAGDDDYWLKVRCFHTRHLDWLLTEQIKAIEGVIRTRTTIVLNTTKETAALPLPQQMTYQA